MAVRLASLVILLLLLTGCLGPSYYLQAVGGHLDLLGRRQPVATLLEDPATPQKLKHKLRHSQALRQFAREQLLLPVKGTFTRYADLERPQATWVLFATPAFSLQPEVWCFPVTGCLQYLGYFDRQGADIQAGKLRQAGRDVHIASSSAYSTLGWFDDPLLNTFIFWPESRLAALMFHEMAHQKLYLSDDSTFNESFAQAVSQIGVRLWLKESGREDLLAEYDRYLSQQSHFLEGVGVVRKQLERVYQSRLSPAKMAVEKQKVLQAAATHHGPGLANGWFAKGVNNAKLASVNTYSRLVPQLLRVYEELGEDRARFYQEMERLAALSKEEREAVLSADQRIGADE
ncbi:MAG: aminopeptidase [Magnetococcales bacterium]|nr:aminopeptidase [Magnetococcales bacterium]